jgi:Family of unknown function (DUF5678)/HicB family
MNLTIDVSEELESKLEEEATRNGVSKNDFVRITLEEKLIHKKRNSMPKTHFESRLVATDLPIRDRSREYDWLAKNGEEFVGKYLALEGNELVSVGETFQQASKKARELGRKDAIVILVEGSNTAPFLGGIW